MLTYHNAISFFGEMYSIGDYRSVRAWAIREFADDPYLEGKTEEDRGKLIDRMVSRSVDLDKISTHVNVMARATRSPRRHGRPSSSRPRMLASNRWRRRCRSSLSN